MQAEDEKVLKSAAEQAEKDLEMVRLAKLQATQVETSEGGKKVDAEQKARLGNVPDEAVPNNLSQIPLTCGVCLRAAVPTTIQLCDGCKTQNHMFNHDELKAFLGPARAVQRRG